MWSMVFPLGMFAVASMKLGRTEHLPVVEAVGKAGLAVAVLAWVAVAAGLVLTLARGLGPGRRCTARRPRPSRAPRSRPPAGARPLAARLRRRDG